MTLSNEKPTLRIFATLFLLASVATAQIPPPKHESRLHHIFARHRDGDNLEQRFQDLRCALVILQSADRVGTGFYIDRDGDVVTASHVLGDRIFMPDGSAMRITLVFPQNITVQTMTERFDVPALTTIENSADQWSADLAVLRTMHPTACWLNIGNDAEVQVGQHAVALGFPGLAFGSLSIYSGPISAKFRSELVTGVTTTGQPVRSNNELFRIQMPISPGISGGPVINDENEVIAVVTSAGAWNPNLDALERAVRQGAVRDPLAATVAQLAEIFHDYASPGYGDAVPLHFLGPRAQQSNRTSAPNVH